MSTIDVVRAWKDEAYRLGLNQEELSQIPAHPAGSIEIAETDFNLATEPRTATPPFLGCGTTGTMGATSRARYLGG